MIISYHYLLVISGIVPNEQAVYAHYAGTSAMALAILISVLLNPKNPELRISYTWLIIIFGLVMAQNIVGSGLEEIADQLFQGGSLTEANPVAIILFIILVPIYLLGWPVWLIWTGRLFLIGKLSFPEQHEAASQTV